MSIDFEPASTNGAHAGNTGSHGPEGRRAGPWRSQSDSLDMPTTLADPAHHRVEIGGFPKATVAMLMVVLFAVGVGDFVNAKTVFDLVFPASASYNAWTLAVSLTSLAIVATHAAGYLWREAGRRRPLKALSAAVVLGWLAAGTLLGFLRVAVASPGASGAGPAAAGNPLAGLHPGASQTHNLAVAAVLGAVWVTTGLVSFSVGYLSHAPAGSALTRLEKRGEENSRGVGEAWRAERRSAHTLTAQQLHASRLPEGWRQADAAAEAHRDQLLAWARVELARVLADPAATNDILPRPSDT